MIGREAVIEPVTSSRAWVTQAPPLLPIWLPIRSTAALPLLFSSLDISIYTISLAGSNRENLDERANTWVMAPAATPMNAIVVGSTPNSMLPDAAMLPAINENKKNTPPESNMAIGVADAAAPQPRYWNTNLPRIMKVMVAHPVAMATSANTV